MEDCVYVGIRHTCVCFLNYLVMKGKSNPEAVLRKPRG